MPAPAEMPVHLVDNVVGSVLLGTIFNAFLFGVTVTQARRYLSRFPTDRFWTRFLVAILLLCDTIVTIDMIAMIYLLTITHFGDYQFLMIMNVTTPIFGFPTMLIQICFHSFLIYRFFMLSRHFWITCALVSISLMAAGACAVSWWSVITYTALETRATKLLPYGLAWETSVAAADLSIAVALSWKLYTLKTSYKKTKSMLRRLIRSSLMGGCWTAALAIAGVITFGVNPQSNWILMFSAMIGRSCTLTVLYNLNARTPTAPRAVTDVTFNGFTADSRTTTGTATSPMLEMKGRRPSSPTRPDDGIMVHRDVVDLDDAGIQLPHVQRVSIVGKSEQEMV